MEERIVVEQVIGSPSALTVEQGNLVYEKIISGLEAKKKIVLDFSNIESIITPFLNVAIGKLYEKYTSDQLKENIDIINQPEGTNRKLNMVIRNAKNFYADKVGFNKIVESVMRQ